MGKTKIKSERLYIATVCDDAKALAQKYSIGIELDQFCTAINMDSPGFQSLDMEVKKLMENSSDKFIFHAPFNELFPAAIDPKILDIAYERYNQAFALAHGYGIEKMVVHSGYMPHVYFKVWHHEKSVKFWREFMKDKPAGFSICIENVLEDEPEMMADIAKELNSLQIKLCLDVGHANCMSKVPIKEWIKVMGPYLGHIHIHNNNSIYDYHAPIQEGDLNMEEILEDIEKYAPEDVTITIESLDGASSLSWLDGSGYLEIGRNNDKARII
ncbi:MAG: sugar phosphate isomerase/epimerase [Anaerovoracaceae bacterium]